MRVLKAISGHESAMKMLPMRDGTVLLVQSV